MVFQREPKERPKIEDVIRVVTKKLNSLDLNLNLDFEEIISEIDQIEERQIDPLPVNTNSNNKQKTSAENKYISVEMTEYNTNDNHDDQSDSKEKIY